MSSLLSEGRRRRKLDPFSSVEPRNAERCWTGLGTHGWALLADRSVGLGPSKRGVAEGFDGRGATAPVRVVYWAFAECVGQVGGGVVDGRPNAGLEGRVDDGDFVSEDLGCPSPGPLWLAQVG